MPFSERANRITVSLCVCVCLYVFACMCALLGVLMRVPVCVPLCVCVRVCVCARMSACMCGCIFEYRCGGARGRGIGSLGGCVQVCTHACVL